MVNFLPKFFYKIFLRKKYFSTKCLEFEYNSGLWPKKQVKYFKEIKTHISMGTVKTGYRKGCWFITQNQLKKVLNSRWTGNIVIQTIADHSKLNNIAVKLCTFCQPIKYIK